MKTNLSVPYIWIAEHKEYPVVPWQFVFDGKPAMKDIAGRFAAMGCPEAVPFPEDWMIRKFPVYMTKRSENKRKLVGFH